MQSIIQLQLLCLSLTQMWHILTWSEVTQRWVWSGDGRTRFFFQFILKRLESWNDRKNLKCSALEFLQVAFDAVRALDVFRNFAKLLTISGSA
jgi:hypothetical protein